MGALQSVGSLLPEIKSTVFLNVFHLVEQAVAVGLFTWLYWCRPLGFCLTTEVCRSGGSSTDPWIPELGVTFSLELSLVTPNPPVLTSQASVSCLTLLPYSACKGKSLRNPQYRYVRKQGHHDTKHFKFCLLVMGVMFPPFLVNQNSLCTMDYLCIIDQKYWIIDLAQCCNPLWQA